MFPTKFCNYTIAFISEFTKYIIATVETNCKLSFGNGRFPVIDADIHIPRILLRHQLEEVFNGIFEALVDGTLFRKFTVLLKN